MSARVLDGRRERKRGKLINVHDSGFHQTGVIKKIADNYDKIKY